MLRNYLAGDVVRVRSGGPDMTVESVADKLVVCSWMAHCENTYAERSVVGPMKMSEDFDPITLVLIARAEEVTDAP